MFAVVGHRDRESACNGLSVFRFDPVNGTLTPLARGHEQLQVGYQFVADCNTFYAVDEILGKDGVIGGSVAAIQLDPASGQTRLLGQARTLFANPSSVCVDKTGRFAVVTHHGGMGSVNRLVLRENGTYDSETCFDTCPALLYERNEDGSLGSICDVWTAPDRGIRSHLHIAQASPVGDIIVVTDKGRGKLYTFRIDAENKKLLFLAEAEDLPGSSPRYGVFHPTLGYFYENSESSTLVNTWAYDGDSGALTLLASEEMYPEGSPIPPQGIGPSDIAMDPNGRFVYVAIRTSNDLASLRVTADGTLELVGRVSCGGRMPRGLCVSPDGAYLYVCNADSGDVVKFAVDDGGRLRCLGREAELSHPGNMVILP